MALIMGQLDQGVALSLDALQALKAVYADVAQVVSPVFAVGGCVRDSLLGKPITDYDFTTPLLPDAVEAAVRAAGRRPYVVGKRFGTVGFKLNGRFFEVTTFRAEQYRKHDRRPEVIFLTELDGDLSRRDFTFNAMAFDGTKLIDPYGGQADLRLGLVRAVGVAEDRLQDDPLRILRAARFAAVMGFSVDLALLDAMRLHWPLLAKVSRERWAIELEKLLAGDHFWLGLDILRKSGALQLVLPELAWLGDEQWQQIEAELPEDEIRASLSATEEEAGQLLEIEDAATKRRRLENSRLSLLLLAAARARGLEPERARVVAIEQAQRLAIGLRLSKVQTAELINNFASLTCNF